MAKKKILFLLILVFIYSILTNYSYSATDAVATSNQAPHISIRTTDDKKGVTYTLSDGNRLDTFIVRKNNMSGNELLNKKFTQDISKTTANFSLDLPTSGNKKKYWAKAKDSSGNIIATTFTIAKTTSNTYKTNNAPQLTSISSEKVNGKIVIYFTFSDGNGIKDAYVKNLYQNTYKEKKLETLTSTTAKKSRIAVTLDEMTYKNGKYYVWVKAHDTSSDNLCLVKRIIITVNKSLTEGQIYAGYSKVCINPNLCLDSDSEKGSIPLAGYGASYNRVAKFKKELQPYQQSLYATAVAISDSNENTTVFVTCDLIGLTSTFVDNIREKVSKDTGLSKDKIMISCTHTHSAPDTTFSNSEYSALTKTVNKYNELLKSKISTACSNAIEDLGLANIYIGSTNIVNSNGSNALNFVRHYETQNTYKNGDSISRGDNHGYYGWDGTKWIETTRTKHTTNADNKLQMIKFDFANKKDILMVNWQAHPHITGSNSLTTISADFIASFRDTVETDCTCRVAYFTGASGNINWSTAFSDGREGIKNISYSMPNSTDENKYYNSIRFGKQLASYVKNKYTKLEKVAGKTVKSNQQNINLNLNVNKNTELLTNARYCYKISTSNFAQIKNMITGKYNWGEDYKFPKGYDSTGKKLRKLINDNPKLWNEYIKITGNDKDGYTCVFTDKVTRTTINKLIAFIGSNFEERIYSPYHASAIIVHSKYINTSKKIEINAISIGDVSFVTAPYEMFDTNGMFIKNNSKSKMTFVLTLTNGKEGYLPSSKCFEYGSYEADTTNFSKGSAETVAKKLVNMISDISQ